MAKKATKRGRPAGAKTAKVDVVDAPLSRCRICGSTEREAYFNRREAAVRGLTADGLPYTRVVWRRTRCTICGQQRDDKHTE